MLWLPTPLINNIMSNLIKILDGIIDSITEGNDMVPFSGVLQGDMAMDYADNLSIQKAKAMLDDYPEGFLRHPIFEDAAFVALNKYGIYVFYNPNTDKIEHWDWKSDVKDLQGDTTYNIMNDWSYLPANEEMNMTNGGMDFWSRIRNGLEVPQ